MSPHLGGNTWPSQKLITRSNEKKKKTLQSNTPKIKLLLGTVQHTWPNLITPIPRTNPSPREQSQSGHLQWLVWQLSFAFSALGWPHHWEIEPSNKLTIHYEAENIFLPSAHNSLFVPPPLLLQTNSLRTYLFRYFVAAGFFSSPVSNWSKIDRWLFFTPRRRQNFTFTCVLCAPSIYIYFPTINTGSFSSLKDTATQTRSLSLAQEIPRNFKKRKFSLRQWFFLLSFLFFFFTPSPHTVVHTLALIELFPLLVAAFPTHLDSGAGIFVGEKLRKLSSFNSNKIKFFFATRYQTSEFTSSKDFVLLFHVSICCFASRSNFSSIFPVYYRIIDSKLLRSPLRSLRNLVARISGNAFSAHSTTNLIMEICPPFRGWAGQLFKLAFLKERER